MTGAPRSIRYFIIALLAASILIVAVAAVQIDYQEYTDFSEVSNCTFVGTAFGGSCNYVGNSTGGNAVTDIVSGVSGKDAYIMYGTGSQTTYAAGTLTGACTSFGAPKIMLFDAAKTAGVSWIVTQTGRYEIVTSGSSASLYRNGNLVSSQAIVNNPYFVGWGAYSFSAGATGCGDWDDLVYGASEDKIVIDMPDNSRYYIKKDFVNPASSGFFNATTNTVVYANYMPVSFSRSNLSGQTFINESIYLINAQTGTVYETQYTGTDLTGVRNFNVGSSLISANAPYGWYQIKINNTLSSTRIAYIANGANIAFSEQSYSIGDTATMTYTVDPSYWLIGEYTYRIVIVDVFGTVHNSQNIAASSGTVTYTWSSDSDTQGVYYAEIIAQRISDGEDVLMNYDYASLVAAFGIDGHVNAAQTALPIAAANVTYSQGSSIANMTSGFDGNYSSSRIFLTGVPIWANVSATGYQTQNLSFTVQAGHTITRNITLNATTPTYTGLAVGGVARDGNLTGQTITNGYGRPIPGATCFLKNTTNGELYQNVTNLAGWHQFDETTPAVLTAGRPYDHWCQRFGYANSPNYTVVA